MGIHVMEHRTVRAASPGGLAGWLLDAWQGLRRHTGIAERRRSEMRVLETLSVGGRKQIHLVSCAGQRFLIGTGPERIDTIVRLRVEPAERIGKRKPGRRPGERS